MRGLEEAEIFRANSNLKAALRICKGKPIYSYKDVSINKELSFWKKKNFCKNTSFFLPQETLN